MTRHRKCMYSRNEQKVRGLARTLISSATPQNDKFIDWLKSKKIILLGKGSTAGQPLRDYFNEIGAQSVLIDSKTPNPQELTKDADIIISSVGKIGLIQPDQLKKDVIL